MQTAQSGQFVRHVHITTEFRNNGATDKIQGVRFGKNGYEFNGSKIDRICSFSKITYQLQQNGRLQQAQKHQPEQEEWHDSMELSSATKKAVTSLGELFDILKPSSGYDENQAEVFRLEAKKRRKKKANQYRQRL